jgi:carbonic anhydrase
MSHTDVLLGNNAKYAKGEVVHEAVHPGAQPIRPAQRVAVVACMDARIDVEDLLGLKTGDAHVIRNAGTPCIPRFQTLTGISPLGLLCVFLLLTRMHPNPCLTLRVLSGGVVTEDAIRSLIISHHLLNTREIILIHHTKCGMLAFTDDLLRAGLEGDEKSIGVLRAATGRDFTACKDFAPLSTKLAPFLRHF